MSTIQVDRIIPFSSSSVTIEGNVVQANAATTGSNTFVGNQNIVGTITASIAEGFALVGGVGSVSTLVATSSFGGALPAGVVSGSTQITALGFATTGSNSFVGNQTISGSNERQILASGFQSITGSSHHNLQGTRAITISKPSFDYPVFEYLYTGISSSFLYNYTENLSATASYTVGVFDNGFTQDVELSLETTTTNGILFKDINSVSGLYTTFLQIAPNGGTNPPIQFKRSAEVTGSVNISQVLKLGAQNPLPANGVGQLAVSGSNLFYNDGSTWTQIN